ncbi:MAG: hypothetical protein IJH20_06155 [Bacilli bacterium]|nr:hypothetical protein [Bacilli bacterium]
MARKAVFEKEYFINKSLDFINEKGIECLSVRELSNYIGCSTQPMFRLFESMDDYKKDLKKKLSEEYSLFCEEIINKNNYLLTSSYAYAMYAKKRNSLFKALFLSDLSDGKIIKTNKAVVKLVVDEYRISEERAKAALRDVGIYTHGLATQLCLKNINLSDKDLFYLINTCIKRNIRI